MLKRDYILALIEDFFKALRLLIEQRTHGNTDNSRQLLEQCYASLRLTEAQRLDATPDQLMELLAVDGNPALSFMEILANLLLEESYLDADHGNRLQERARVLLRYVDERDDTFSFDRLGKIEMIDSLLGATDQPQPL